MAVAAASTVSARVPVSHGTGSGANPVVLLSFCRLAVGDSGWYVTTSFASASEEKLRMEESAGFPVAGGDGNDELESFSSSLSFFFGGRLADGLLTNSPH